MVSFTGPFDDSRLDGADLAMPFPRRTIPNNQIPFTFRWNGPIASIEKPIRHNRSVHKFLAIRSRFLPSYELDFKPGSSFLFFFFFGFIAPKWRNFVSRCHFGRPWPELPVSVFLFRRLRRRSKWKWPAIVPLHTSICISCQLWEFLITDRICSRAAHFLGPTGLKHVIGG